MRGFKFCKGYENLEANHVPKRKTEGSAGYDFLAAEDIEIPPYKGPKEVTVIKTGIKAYMEPDEVLELYNRSSNPKKRSLFLSNGAGIIDQDYYENEENDGHIMFSFINLSEETVVVRKGEAIGQGIFKKYLKIDEDHEQVKEKRIGGFGSTDK